MKVVILAGGLGTRLSEETVNVPKPMVEIGGMPILWHIMKIYAAQGFDEFVVALGYKGDVIKRFFYDYGRLRGSLTIDLAEGGLRPHAGRPGSLRETWRVHLMETGLESLTAGRLLRLKDFLGDEPFMLTYGDGVSNIDLNALLAFHRAHGRLGTITAVRPPARFGGLDFGEDGEIREFIEKPQIGEGWINGGFMVLEPEILARIPGEDAALEGDVLEPLSRERALMAYRHEGYWQCMDTLRDRRILNDMWESGAAPWRIWE
ncbi:glucose-1-phosphate cytidylyltransferase [Salinarimonas rosea]|uniref:glucose-1-phosphate cytidylyltransferase n=1 Tax=Salinarimonas rosea TaxID=552063 RepID=UPI00041888E9|nr:glucose-1-phosphate cytidylyltransferase [Salinarimonas rosea]